MMKARVAGAGVKALKPAPSFTDGLVWHPATAKSSTQIAIRHATDLFIRRVPFSDEVHGPFQCGGSFSLSASLMRLRLEDER
jgi:hypothetical protein